MPSGVQVLPVSDWNVTYDGFPYLEWLTTAGMIVTTPTLPSAQVSRPYSARLTATGGKGADRWAVTAGSLPPGLALSARRAALGDGLRRHRERRRPVGSWPFTVTATDPKGAAAIADLQLAVNGTPDAFYYDSSTGSLRDALWTSAGWAFTTLDGSSSTLAGHTVRRRRAGVERGRDRRRADGVLLGLDHQLAAGRLAGRARPAAGGSRPSTGPGSTLAGHTADHVGGAISAVVVAGEPEVFYYDATRRRCGRPG